MAWSGWESVCLTGSRSAMGRVRMWMEREWVSLKKVPRKDDSWAETMCLENLSVEVLPLEIDWVTAR